MNLNISVSFTFLFLAATLFSEICAHKKFNNNLLSGILGALTSVPPLDVQSPNALAEENIYSAVTEHQEVSRTTRLLEDELMKLQRKVQNIDKLTEEERKEMTWRLKKKKLQLAAAISRTAKILRAAYNIAHPDRQDKPIIIVPKDVSDDEIEKAFIMLKEGEEDLRAHRRTQCAAIADAFVWTQQQHISLKDEFKKQTDILARLPLIDRIAFDKEKIHYWKNKVEKLNQQVSERI